MQQQAMLGSSHDLCQPTLKVNLALTFCPLTLFLLSQDTFLLLALSALLFATSMDHSPMNEA